jgi:hypothetical protein
MMILKFFVFFSEKYVFFREKKRKIMVQIRYEGQMALGENRKHVS